MNRLVTVVHPGSVSKPTHTVRVLREAEPVVVLEVPEGQRLRDALLEAGISPHGRYTHRLNCAGNGICATCGVWFRTNEPVPTHWHDRAASAWGYPRLSCQIVVSEEMEIELVEQKAVWGPRDPSKRASAEGRAGKRSGGRST